MQTTFFRNSCAVIAIAVLSACTGASDGGGDGDTGGDNDSGGLPVLPTEPVFPADEVPPSALYRDLSDRSVATTAAASSVVLNGQTVNIADVVTINFANGTVSGGLLDGTDLDTADFINPANGEFSRIARVSGSNIFGAVGLDVLANDLPAMGTVTDYNDGWVGMTASFEDEVYVLQGDATFTTTWGTGDIDGRFFNLSGTNSANTDVTNVGVVILTDASVTDDSFTGGRVTGLGIFEGLGNSSSTAGTNGTFFGPQADELGGVLVVDDSVEDIQILGAFQAD